MARRTLARVVTYGLDAEATIRATELSLNGQGQAAYTLRTPEGSARVTLQYVGQPQVSNSLAAAAVGREAGLPVEQIAHILSQATPRSSWRMETTLRADG